VIGFAFQPVGAGQWAQLKTVLTDAAAGDPRLAPWTKLDDAQGALAAGSLQMAIQPGFWEDAARWASLPAGRRAELIKELSFARERSGRVISGSVDRAMADAQRKISQGRLGEDDLASLASRLEALAVHGDKVRSAALELRSAVALSKARREAASFASRQDAGAVAGGETASGSNLAPASGEKTAPREAPVPSPKSVRTKHWAIKVVLITAATYLADIGSKAFAHAYLFNAFHEVAWRKPLMMFVIPYILFAAWTALTKLPQRQQDIHWSRENLGRRGAGLSGWLGFTKEPLPGLDEVAKSHPSMYKTFSHFEIAVGFMLGGLLGNGIDAILKNGALDWIPVGRSLMNFADVAILIGLSYFQLASIFFANAARAARDKKQMTLDLTNFLGLPLLGFFIAWAFGSGVADDALSLAMKSTGFIYLMGFSMLIGIARYAAALLMRREVKKFNEDPK
jgi:hypothetical protein